ncbi:MAG: sulfatase [Chitinophagales bacterium]|nr:MAG: sulfatase [Chitinophagales bacterium]
MLFFLSYALFWLAFFFTIRLAFITVNFLDAGMTLSLIEFKGAFVHGFKLDLSATAYLMLIPGMLLAFSNIIGNTKSLITLYTTVMAGVIILFTIVDLRFYKYLGARLDIAPFRFLKSPKAVFASLTIGDFVIPLSIAALLAVIFIFIYRKLIPPITGKGNKYVVPFSFLLLDAALIIPMRGGIGLAPINIGSVYFSNNLYANHCAINLPWNVVYSITMLNAVENRYNFMDAQSCQALMQKLYPEKRTVRNVLKTNRPDILLIVLESFTAKMLHMQRDGKAITPELNRLVRQGVYFSNFYASGDRTDKGLPAILSGYPAQPVTSIINIHKKMETLPNIIRELKKAGYETYFFYGGDIDFSNFRSYLLHGGIAHLITQEAFPTSTPRAKWGVHDGIVLDTVAARISTMQSPFFTVVLLLSSHEPYVIPEEPLFEGDDQEILFLNAAHYTDKCVGRFIETIRQSPTWSNLLIAITADHGHKWPGNTEMNHPEKFRIPFLLTGGALTVSDSVITVIGSQTDIATTLLDQLYIPADFRFGKNLLAQDVIPFAWYSFNDGFGFVTLHGTLVYDNRLGDFTRSDSGVTEEQKLTGKAYLQTVMADYASR